MRHTTNEIEKGGRRGAGVAAGGRPRSGGLQRSSHVRPSLWHRGGGRHVASPVRVRARSVRVRKAGRWARSTWRVHHACALGGGSAMRRG